MSQERPLRADARRNRDRILAVADDVFGAGGEAASTEEVARRAGVGIGTVFRHFPTKQSLLEAVFAARLEDLHDRALSLVDADDAGVAFFDFFRHAVQTAPGKLSIAGASVDAGVDIAAAVRDRHTAVRSAFGDLLKRAQAAGAVRPDVDLPEVYAVLVATSRTAASARLEPELVDRALTIVFDGLRRQDARTPFATDRVAL